MTSKSSGRVNTCCKVMSAIASLITMPAPGLPIGIRHHGPPSSSSAPKKFFAEEVENLVRFRGGSGVFDPSINIFRVFAEDDHVDFLRAFYRGGDAFEILNRPQTNIQIEQLTERNVQRSDAAADRSSERA